MIQSIVGKYCKTMHTRSAKYPRLTESVAEFDDINHNRL